ncbi:MAG TPA: hypothetical protein VN903_04015 [Polyangia bacterium]|nr:hypothetical protein [Polyangia bacterium]
MTETLRLAGILTRFRVRSIRNALRAHGRGRSFLVATIIGVVTAFAYVGLFTQAFSIVAHTVGLAGQVAVLALATGTIAFGSLSARAASSEAVRAGSPENEFLLARPVSLHVLVAARGLSDAIVDPVGGLFLLPVLISATFVWRLGVTAVPISIAVSLLAQIGISTLAYAVQLAVVRYIPARRRRMVWTGLRLMAALSLAMLWMLGSWVMRAPDALAKQVAHIAPALAMSPAALITGPLAALVRGQLGQVALALAALAASVTFAMLLTVAIARRAGMHGWEEAGAVWADAARVPPAMARLPTAATKDLRLIVRDRSQLLALIALPVIFIGVQIFGAAGWTWTTASLARISWLAYSLALYMGTIGPLTHMQAERRAFWILRTVPVPLTHLLAAKARAWAIILGGIAAVVFTVLSLSVPNATLADRIASGLLVTMSAAGMSFVAVAMASGGADLSDDSKSAVGPTTIYGYMLVGGLFNVVLDADFATRLAGVALYAIAGWAYWQAGVDQVGFCLDAEAVRERRVRAADGATMLIILAMGGRAFSKAVGKFTGAGIDPALVGKIVFGGYVTLALLVGIAAVIYLARRPARVPLRGWVASLFIALGAAAAGAGVVAIVRVVMGAGDATAWLIAAGAAQPVDEIVLRGVLQRAVPLRPVGAAAVTVLAGLAAAQVAAASFSMGLPLVVALISSHIFGAAVYGLTGRVTAAYVARVGAVVLVGVGAFA